jgi:hypothetical protein
MRERFSPAEILLQAAMALHLERYRVEQRSKVQLGLARECMHDVLANHSLVDALLALCRFYAEDFWEPTHLVTTYKKHVDTLLAHAKMGTAVNGRANEQRQARVVAEGDEDFERERQEYESRRAK